MLAFVRSQPGLQIELIGFSFGDMAILYFGIVS